MRFEPFALERWLLQSSAYDLASAGISRLRLDEVIGGIDPGSLLSYGLTNGSDAIRSGVATLYAGAVGREVLITTGTAEANFLALYALLEPGDEVVALNPTYMQHRGIAQSLGAEVRVIELREEEGWKLDMDELRRQITDRTRVVALVNPNNPVGSVISSDEMGAICDMAGRFGAWVLCDGALRGTETDGHLAASPVEFHERGIATGSLTKLGMPGIRVGWLVAEPGLVAKCWALKDYVTLSHSGLGEQIAIAALDPGKLDGFMARARQRVREHSAVVAEWIAEMEPLVSWTRPTAGHTAFPRYTLGMDSVRLCQRLLSEEDVLLTPGDYFHSPGHFRLRYSGDREALDGGLRRLESFLRKYSGSV